MKDVAAEAGVSPATVSRVLNSNPAIPQRTVDRVNEAMRRLNYQPNLVARSLRTVSTSTLGALVSNVANPFFASLVRGIEDRAAETGLRLVLGNADEKPERQMAYLDSFMAQQVDGLIVSPTGSDPGWVEDLLERKVPLVFVDRTVPGVEVPSVTTDHTTALSELMEHLMSNGHRSAAVITADAANTPIRRRVADLQAIAADMGFTLAPEHIIEGGARAEGASRAVHDLLHPPGTRPDVLIALSNTMALGTLTELSRAGLSIPADIAFASYDDSPWFTVIQPNITAISQPVDLMGRLAVDLVSRLIAGEPVQSTTVPALFIPRGSALKVNP